MLLCLGPLMYRRKAPPSASKQTHSQVKEAPSLHTDSGPEGRRVSLNWKSSGQI